MTFILPYLLPLMALASVPIIIHLLNRRRFQIVEWAPMKYLKLTIKTNRRRLRIEQILLLIIRTLIVMLLIFAIARPVLSPTGLGGWLAGRSRTSRIIVIDDSLSMGYRDNGRSAFDAAKEAVDQIIKATGAQDAVTVIRASNLATPIVHDVHLDDTNRVISAINSLAATDGPSDWPAIFRAVGDQLSTATFPTKEVVLVTDLRKSGWDAQVSEYARKWADDRVAMKVIDVGSRQTANVSLATLESEDPLSLPNTPVNLVAKIRNNTASPITGTQAMLIMNDQTRPIILPTLPSGETTDVPLTVTPTAAGQMPIKLSLTADALPGDDSRFFCLTVRPTLDVTLVDGEPSAQPFESETDFLALAYTIGAEPWHITHTTENDWATVKNASSDVIVVANVASLTAQQVSELERLVNDGAGLMIFCGDLMDVAAYNDRLYRDGNGLLPVKLDSAVDGPVNGFVAEAVQNSPLELLTKIAPAALSGVRVNRYMGVDNVKTSPDVRVLARWNNSQNAPAVIEKRFGRGQVLLFTVTADKAWSDWPLDRSFVLATRQAAMSIAKSSSQQDNISAGQPIQLSLAQNESATDPKIRLPNGEFSPMQVLPRTDQSPAILKFDQTAQAGSYNIFWKDSTGHDQTRLVCVSPNPSESDLEPISDHDLSAILDPLDATIVHYAGEASLSDKGHEIWRTVAMCLMMMLGIETLFAVWVGRER
jgi:Aerotolerance regulator N-terminal/von Willebrand factor type A domain